MKLERKNKYYFLNNFFVSYSTSLFYLYLTDKYFVSFYIVNLRYLLEINIPQRFLTYLYLEATTNKCCSNIAEGMEGEDSLT